MTIKNNGFKILVLFCSLFLIPSAFTQTSTFSPTGSFSLDLGVPAKPHNRAFELTMEGLLNAGIDYRRNVYSGLTIGAGLKYSFFTINSFAFNNTAISGGFQAPGGYLFLGYEKFTTDRISFTGSVRAGYSLMMSFNDSCKAKLEGPHIDQSYFLEPQVEMVMLTDKISEHGFSMVLGYSFYFHEFGKSDLCMDDISAVLEEDYEGIMRYLSIGFGYRYYMGRR